MTVRMDVVDVDSINAAHAAVERGFGRVDVLVNNAGVLIAEHDEVLAIPSEAYRRTFETNVFGVIEVCRLFAPAMARAGYGRIVNVSSGAGQLTAMSTTYAPAYSTSKTTLNAFTRILAHTYRAKGVLVNEVDPGWVRTDMGALPPRDHPVKARTRLRGSRRSQTMARAAASFTTDAPSNGSDSKTTF